MNSELPSEIRLLETLFVNEVQCLEKKHSPRRFYCIPATTGTGKRSEP
jgi:hypothetical protein